MEFNIRLSNGQILRGIIKSPGEHLRAVILLIHGLGEHVLRYNQWAEMFNARGIGFAGVDLPGHGRTDGRRGHIKSYGLIEELINTLINESRKTFPGVPVFLYGHSMGGGIVLDYILRKKPKVKGAVVSSPWLRLSFEPDKIKQVIAAVMKFIMPGLVMSSGLIPSQLSHDNSQVEDYTNDPLVHFRISVALFYGTIRAAVQSLANSAELATPVLLLHGSDDPITSPEGSRRFAEKTELAEFRLFEGGFHGLHYETFREEVFTVIIDWIEKRLASK
ncbi:MAG: lysophospholipase [Bacteroidales bacterium]|nr:lysophospholipase [Bacteroidales bacterium]